MSRIRVLLNSKAHQLGWLRNKKIKKIIAGGQEVDHTFVKFIIYPFAMITNDIVV